MSIESVRSPDVGAPGPAADDAPAADADEDGAASRPLPPSGFVDCDGAVPGVCAVADATDDGCLEATSGDTLARGAVSPIRAIVVPESDIDGRTLAGIAGPALDALDTGERAPSRISDATRGLGSRVVEAGEIGPAFTCGLFVALVSRATTGGA